MTIDQGSIHRKAAFALEGELLIADASGALYWPEQQTLIVADMHLEKGSSFARRGVFLPPYDTRVALAALELAMSRYRPRRVIALGDSFHDRDGAGRLCADDYAKLQSLMTGRDWIWVLGNHDPAPPKQLGGVNAQDIEIGRLVFRHEPRPGSSNGEIAGHLHPCATLRAKGRQLRRRCFAFDGTRLVLPAFGAFAGGLCVFDEAFAFVLRAPFTAMLLGRQGVYPISHTRLVPDAV